MMTVPDIIDSFGGATAFALLIGKNPSTASEMKRNRSIPVRYWPRVVDEAASRGIHITNDTLVAAHTAPPDEPAVIGAGDGADRAIETEQFKP